MFNLILFFAPSFLLKGQIQFNFTQGCSRESVKEGGDGEEEGWGRKVPSEREGIEWFSQFKVEEISGFGVGRGMR